MNLAPGWVCGTAEWGQKASSCVLAQSPCPFHSQGGSRTILLDWHKRTSSKVEVESSPVEGKAGSDLPITQTQDSLTSKDDVLVMLEMLNPFMSVEEDRKTLKTTIGQCSRCVTAFHAKAKADYDKVSSEGVEETMVMMYVIDANVIEKLTDLWSGALFVADSAGVKPEMTIKQAIHQLRSGHVINERLTPVGRARDAEY